MPKNRDGRHWCAPEDEPTDRDYVCPDCRTLWVYIVVGPHASWARQEDAEHVQGVYESLIGTNPPPDGSEDAQEAQDDTVEVPQPEETSTRKRAATKKTAKKG